MTTFATAAAGAQVALEQLGFEHHAVLAGDHFARQQAGNDLRRRRLPSRPAAPAHVENLRRVRLARNSCRARTPRCSAVPMNRVARHDIAFGSSRSTIRPVPNVLARSRPSAFGRSTRTFTVRVYIIRIRADPADRALALRLVAAVARPKQHRLPERDVLRVFLPHVERQPHPRRVGHVEQRCACCPPLRPSTPCARRPRRPATSAAATSSTSSPPRSSSATTSAGKPRN